MATFKSRAIAAYDRRLKDALQHTQDQILKAITTGKGLDRFETEFSSLECAHYVRSQFLAEEIISEVRFSPNGNFKLSVDLHQFRPTEKSTSIRVPIFTYSQQEQVQYFFRRCQYREKFEPNSLRARDTVTGWVTIWKDSTVEPNLYPTPHPLISPTVTIQFGPGMDCTEVIAFLWKEGFEVSSGRSTETSSLDQDFKLSLTVKLPEKV